MNKESVTGFQQLLIKQTIWFYLFSGHNKSGDDITVILCLILITSILKVNSVQLHTF